MIIVSNRQRLDQKRIQKKKPKLIFMGAWLLLIIILLIFVPPFRYLAFMAFLPLLGIAASFARPRTYFEAYTDEQQALHFAFTDTREQSDASRASFRTAFRIHEERMQIQPGTLWGYESHSFISKEQQLICLLLRTREGILRTRPIPVEYLNEQEKKILYTFLDNLIAHNKRMAVTTSPDSTRYLRS